MILDRQALAAAAAMVFLALPAAGQPVFPGRDWQSGDAAGMGWSSPRLAAARDSASGMGASAVMIVQHGRVVASWGDPARRVRVNSMRKSVLSALYGLAIAEGRIDLGATLADLDIDDTPPALSPAEKRATVRDLLMARSGVYHDAASESEAMKSRRPARGGHAPGAHWYYNNWDFNAAGGLFEQRTGKPVFEALRDDLAVPLQFEDFELARDTESVQERASKYPAYVMKLSSRDLARVGLLMARGGQWRGRQLVSARWVAESTAPHTPVLGGWHGYALMWWVPRRAWPFWKRAEGDVFFAWGNGGQFVFVDRGRDLVVVHQSDRSLFSGGASPETISGLLEPVLAAAPAP